MARRPVIGRGQVARFFAKLFPGFAPGAEIWPAEVNGEPALLAWSGGVLFGVFVPEIADGRITALRAVANPDKLGFVARQVVSHSALSHSAGLSGLLLVTDDE